VDGPHPPYIGLSYAWGENVRYDDVDFDGQLFPVSRNLWHFLDQMRRGGKYATSWIDANCIDQSNTKARNHQIQMMQQIYSNAVSVPVWLDEEDVGAHSNFALDYLKRSEDWHKALYFANSASFPLPQETEAVFALCNRPYWTRVWMVQEIVLARDITVHCGSRTVSWNNFWRAFYAAPYSTILTEAAATDVVFLKPPYPSEARQWSLSDLLLKLHKQHSTDVRDKIYALHGLADDTDNMLADYGITVDDLIVDVLRHACMSCQRAPGGLAERRTHIVRFGRLLCEMFGVLMDVRRLENIVAEEAQNIAPNGT
jgi:hypothetical protein